MRPQDRLGMEVGGCRLEQLLGQGAYGAVYQATQLSLARAVAVKVLTSTGTADASFQERFIREARVIAALDSVNVIRVYDMGRTSDGEPYIVMELVDGMSLDELLDVQGTLDEPLAANLIEQAARGVAVAAEHGVIHRDIKPANLMITRKAVIKVADFGLAKAGEEANSLTQSGAILGTPYYMAPELAKGDEIDCRADIYSLGVTLYQLLTGEVPFTGPTAVSVLYQHVTSPAPDLSATGEYSTEIARVIVKAMAKEPAERYQTALELADALVKVRETQAHAGRAPAEPFELPERPKPSSWPNSSIETTNLAETLIDTSKSGARVGEPASSALDQTIRESSDAEAPPLDPRPTKPAYAPWGNPDASPTLRAEEAADGSQTIRADDRPKPSYAPWGSAADSPPPPVTPRPTVQQVGREIAEAPRYDAHAGRGPRDGATWRVLLVCRLDRVLPAGRPGATSLDLDTALGHLLGLIQRVGGQARRVLDRIVILVDSPGAAVQLLEEGRQRLKEALPSKSVRDRWTLRGLLHGVHAARLDLDCVSEDEKMVAFDICDMVRPGTTAATEQALSQLQPAERQFFDIDKPRTLSGRAGVLKVHPLQRKKSKKS